MADESRSNTYGLGACLQSKSGRQRILRDAGIASFDHGDHSPPPIAPSKALPHAGDVRRGNFRSRPTPAQYFSTERSASA